MDYPHFSLKVGDFHDLFVTQESKKDNSDVSIEGLGSKPQYSDISDDDDLTDLEIPAIP